MIDFHHNTTVRPCTEEANLCMNVHDQDVTNAEFIRTFRCINFPGYLFLQRLEMEMHSSKLSYKQLRVIPAPKNGNVQKEIVLRNIDDFYGYRPGPSEPRLFYLTHRSS